MPFSTLAVRYVYALCIGCLLTHYIRDIVSTIRVCFVYTVLIIQNAILDIGITLHVCFVYRMFINTEYHSRHWQYVTCVLCV
jgi:hypothetical protein